jgi:hypothetical protein
MLSTILNLGTLVGLLFGAGYVGACVIDSFSDLLIATSPLRSRQKAAQNGSRGSEVIAAIVQRQRGGTFHARS